jgi:hypothetical protein
MQNRKLPQSVRDAMKESEKQQTPCDEARLRGLALLFLCFCVLCLLAGASRLSSADWNLHRCADILRVRDMLSLFLFAPAVSLCFWLFYKCLARGAVTSTWNDLLCILAIWFIACGMGIHDPANCLQSAYRRELAAHDALRGSIEFIDDHLGHWVFWSGFVLGVWTLGVRQILAPLEQKMTLRWRIAFSGFTAALLWVMLTNLWNEYPRTRSDLAVIALAVAPLVPLQMALARRVSLWRLPLLCVLYGACWGSIAGTLICWQVRYRVLF